MSKKTPLTSEELQGISQLLTEATLSVTDLVEEFTQKVLYPSFLPATPIQHLISSISGFTFKSIKFITESVGYGVEASLQRLDTALFDLPDDKKTEIIAILNGIVGDHLQKQGNALAVQMQFFHQGQQLLLNNAVKTTTPSPRKLLIMIHGLCMNHHQWTRKAHNHGEKLAKDFGFTPIYLHYNSGLHISSNGQKLAALMEKLLATWGSEVEEIVLLGHSMGGLVTRSAIHYGEEEQYGWIQKVKNLIFLGTPHHGAPLERAGNHIDVLLESVPYAKPFARIGKIRSAGITDLRYGTLLDDDWVNENSTYVQTRSLYMDLPKHITSFAVAAALAKEAKVTALSLLGDGLVPVKSALGKHEDESKALSFLPNTTHLVYEHGHLDLLDSLQVYEQLKEWLEQ